MLGDGRIILSKIGQMMIYWELGDVETTVEKLLMRQIGIWVMQDVKLSFLKFDQCMWASA